MTRRAYLYFVLTFLLGGVVGGAAVVFYAWHWGHWHRGFDRGRMVRRLSRDLELSQEQVRQLRVIVDETGKKFAELRKQAGPQFEALREESFQRIRAILNPEQLKKFEEQVRRHKERMQRERSP